MKQEFDEFVTDCRKDIAQEKKETEHCIILYKCKGFFNETKITHKVYKTIDDFAERGYKDMLEIEPSWGIAPQLWFFD